MSDQRQPDSDFPRILPAGDAATSIEFGSVISEEINDRIYSFAEALEAAPPEWLMELVPTYRSLLVQYDPLLFDFDQIEAEIKTRLAATSTNSDTTAPERKKLVYELPTLYGGEHGPDLETVANHAGLSADQVVSTHSSTAYRVYMIGFSPGFPYLGGMDEKIACPRLATPRTRVPAGSVGIAESQTGVYPSESPGGWQLIGRTPVKLFDPDESPPSILQPGHFVKFVPVEADEFAEMEKQIEAGEFSVTASELDS